MRRTRFTAGRLDQAIGAYRQTELFAYSTR